MRDKILISLCVMLSLLIGSQISWGSKKNDSFTVSQLLVIGKCQYKCDNYQLATVVKGSGKVDEYDVKVGDNFLIPTNTSIELDGQMMIMMTTK